MKPSLNVKDGSKRAAIHKRLSAYCRSDCSNPVGGLVGGIAAWERNGLPGECYLVRVYILPEMQNKGIATQAILLCEAEFPNTSRWTLVFPADQSANRRCYEKAGYVDTGETREQSEGRITLAMYEKRITNRLSELT